MYSTFSLKNRFILATLLNSGYEQLDIAESMGGSPSLISREISRYSRTDGIYKPRYAHKLSKLRRKGLKVNSRKIENDNILSLRIEKRLHPLVSPEVIAQDKNICRETIYAKHCI